MEQPQGRTTDMIRLPSGTVLAHRLMGMFAAHPEAVRLSQTHQLADHSITIRVVEGDGADARSQIESAVAALLFLMVRRLPGPTLSVTPFPYTGGKTKYIISDVPPSA